MIIIPGIKGQSFGVFGLGATGLATAEALIASGAEVYTWDENPVACEKTANTQYRAEHPINWPWDKLTSLILSPGVPLTYPAPHQIVEKARKEGVEIIGDIELFARALAAYSADTQEADPSPGNTTKRPRLVAVTGSNGKSTTTSLITHSLRETGHRVHEGGNIGQAVLSLPAFEPNAIYVLELSSYQLDLTTSLHPDISVFLNISPDHLDRHGGMDGYVAAKRRIFKNQTDKDHAIIGVDDPVSQSICTDIISSRKMTVTPISALGTLGGGVFALGNALFYNFDQKTTKAGDIPETMALRGTHNQQNAAAAFGVCARLGASPPLIMLAMSKFKGLAHRMEKVGDIGHVTFVNDSKATNGEATVQALGAFDAIFWLAGGKPKEGGLETVIPALQSVKAAYVFGDAAPLFHDQLKEHVPTTMFKTLDEATEAAFKEAMQSPADNPVVLLSPAAASFDQYRNFEERGEAFRSLVQTLNHEGGAAA